MDPMLKNENRGYLLHLENIFYQKGYFLEVKLRFQGKINGNNLYPGR